MKKTYTILLLLTTTLLFGQKIPFQGRLLDNNSPYTGTATIEFSITSLPWTETINNVDVQDGYYSVVLGEITPLPDTLFDASPEVILDITVNGEALSPVTLYSPFLPHTGSEPLEIDTVQSFAFEALGINDESRASLTTTNDGYDGLMVLGDSLGRTGNFMRTRTSGGYLQLTQQDFDTDEFKSAALMGTTGDQNSFLDLFGGNAANDAIQLMARLYSSNIDLNGPIPDGYRRGGLDLYNYHGGLTHTIFSEQVGTDASGSMAFWSSQDGANNNVNLFLSSGNGVDQGGIVSVRDITGTETISIDGTSGVIDAQQLLVQGVPVGGSSGGNINPDTVRANSVQVLSPIGELKADLNYFEPNDAGSVVLYANNDTRNIILGSSGITGGDTGFLGLYDTNDQIKVAIRVDTLDGGGQDFGQIILNNSDYSKSLTLDGSRSAVKADTLETLEIMINGESGSQKVSIGTENNGYDGVIVLTDSLNNSGAFMTTNRGTGTGGYLQLNGRDNVDGTLRSAVVAGTIVDSRQNSFMDLYGENAAADGPQLLVDVYASDTDQFGVQLPDGYRRGGVDISNYHGASTHNIFSFQDGTISKSAIALNTSENGTNFKQTVFIQSGDTAKDARIELFGRGASAASLGIENDPGGSDPDGATGGIVLFGDDSFNFHLTADKGFDNDLAQFNMYGSYFDTGASFWYNSSRMETVRASTGDEFGQISFQNTTSGGISNNTSLLTGNLNETGAGGLELYDASGAVTVIIDGNAGNLSVNRPSDGGSAANIFTASENGGIAIQNAANTNKFFYEANAGTLNLNDDGALNTISLDGNFGNILVTGDVAGNTITSSDGSVQTSDKRLKKEIKDLENPLEKTLQMRGVTYKWKDEKKSQRNQVGVIAQEVEEIYPEFVRTDKNGMKAVNYAQMTAVLIEAIKELNAKVEKLETENSSLKASLSEVETLRKEMDQLMKILGSSKAASK